MPATPTQSSELEEALLDKRLLERYTDADGHLNEGKFLEFIRPYQVNYYSKHPDQARQMRDLTREGAKDFAAHNDIPVFDGEDFVDPSKMARPKKSTAYKGLGLNAWQKRQIAATGRGPAVKTGNKKYETLSSFLVEAMDDFMGHGTTDQLKVYNNLTEGMGSDGGFLVPEEFRAMVLMLALENAVVRRFAQVIPMGSITTRVPSIKDTSHATNVFGGVSGTWVAEGGDVSSSTNQPLFSQILLTARKLTGYTVGTNDLLADSAVALEALIYNLFGAAIAYFEDDAFFQGTGAGQPLGFMNADALVSISKETGQPTGTVLWENVVKMYARMLPQSLNRAVWIIAPDVLPQLLTMSLAVGTGGSAMFMGTFAQGGGQNGMPLTLLGRPIIISEKAQALSTAGDINFVDLSYYLIGDRQTLSIVNSPHVRFTTDEQVWRFVQRVDGRPWIQSALTPRHGSNTLSPFVNLASR